MRTDGKEESSGSWGSLQVVLGRDDVASEQGPPGADGKKWKNQVTSLEEELTDYWI